MTECNSHLRIQFFRPVWAETQATGSRRVGFGRSCKPSPSKSDVARQGGRDLRRTGRGRQIDRVDHAIVACRLRMVCEIPSHALCDEHPLKPLPYYPGFGIAGLPRLSAPGKILSPTSRSATDNFGGVK